MAHYKEIYNIDIESIVYQYDILACNESTTRKSDLKTQIKKYNKENPKDSMNEPIARIVYRYSYMLTSGVVTDAFCTAYSVPEKWGPISKFLLGTDLGSSDEEDNYDEYFCVKESGVGSTSASVCRKVDLAQ